MRNQQDYNLIWKHTHRDYKGTIEGVRYVLVNRSGGTHSVSLHDLTDAECADSLQHAKSREARSRQTG